VSLGAGVVESLLGDGDDGVAGLVLLSCVGELALYCGVGAVDGVVLAACGCGLGTMATGLVGSMFVVLLQPAAVKTRGMARASSNLCMRISW
jgi:hypothetical protein